MVSSIKRIPPGAWVALGGGAGAMARFHTAGWVTTWAWSAFPWPTLAINVVGSALLGFFLRVLPPPERSSQARAFLLVGLCGGFTTFSMFDLETLSMLSSGRYAAAAGYAVVSVSCCIAGVYAGFGTGAVIRRAARPAIN